MWDVRGVGGLRPQRLPHAGHQNYHQVNKKAQKDIGDAEHF